MGVRMSAHFLRPRVGNNVNLAASNAHWVDRMFQDLRMARAEGAIIRTFAFNCVCTGRGMVLHIEL